MREHVAILGAGAGGAAAAAVYARRGFEVRLYNRTPERLAPIRDRGGIEITGDQGEGLAPIARVTTDVGEAVEDAAIVLVFTHANGQAYVAQQLTRHLRDGHVVVFCSGSAGSLEAARIWREAGVVATVLLGETVTLPQSARAIGPARYTVRIPARPRTAAFPGRDTDRLRARLAPLFPTLPSPNVMDTGLNNPNFLIHPAPMILNYAAIERADGLLSIMNEGMTPATLRVMDAHDLEKQALAAACGLVPASLDELYVEWGSSPAVYRSPGEPMGLRDRIHWRYIDEDVPFGTVFWSSLGRMLGVPTPVSDGIVHLACAARGVDYWAIGRTVETLGIAGMSAARLQEYLHEGR